MAAPTPMKGSLTMDFTKKETVVESGGQTSKLDFDDTASQNIRRNSFSGKLPEETLPQTGGEQTEGESSGSGSKRAGEDDLAGRDEKRRG